MMYNRLLYNIINHGLCGANIDAVGAKIHVIY